MSVLSVVKILFQFIWNRGKEGKGELPAKTCLPTYCIMLLQKKQICGETGMLYEMGLKFVEKYFNTL
jgi:hypothetical protein